MLGVLGVLGVLGGKTNCAIVARHYGAAPPILADIPSRKKNRPATLTLWALAVKCELT